MHTHIHNTNCTEYSNGKNKLGSFKAQKEGEAGLTISWWTRREWNEKSMRARDRLKPLIVKDWRAVNAMILKLSVEKDKLFFCFVL